MGIWTEISGDMNIYPIAKISSLIFDSEKCIF